jgi:hypothetical protein
MGIVISKQFLVCSSAFGLCGFAFYTGHLAAKKCRFGRKDFYGFKYDFSADYRKCNQLLQIHVGFTAVFYKFIQQNGTALVAIWRGTHVAESEFVLHLGLLYRWKISCRMVVFLKTFTSQ